MNAFLSVLAVVFGALLAILAAALAFVLVVWTIWFLVWFFLEFPGNVRMAFRSVLQHGKRTLFLCIALGSVTAMLVLLQGLAAGIRETMLHTATTLSTGDLNVGGFFKPSAGQSAPVVTKWEETAKVVKASVPEMRYLVQRGRGWAKIVSDRGSMQAGIGGIDIKSEPEFKKVLKITSGNIDDLSQPNTIMVFEGQLEKLDVKVGDAITISAQTTRGVANTIDCRVVAIAKDIGLLSKWNIYVPSETLRALYQLRPDATGALHIHLDDHGRENLGAIAARLRTSLTQAGYRVMEPDSKAFWMKFESVNREDWTGQKLDVTTWEDELSFMTWTLQLLNGLTVVLMFILVCIVVVGIMNTTWIAIRERTREIGTLRAIGMQRGRVARMFQLESLLLGVGGTIAGAIGGTLIAAGLNALHIHVPLAVQLFLMSDQLHLRVQPGVLVVAILAFSYVATVAALYPSWRAARLRPIEAMSHFG
jgi:putative ABC transport system permease protein